MEERKKGTKWMNYKRTKDYYKDFIYECVINKEGENGEEGKQIKETTISEAYEKFIEWFLIRYKNKTLPTSQDF